MMAAKRNLFVVGGGLLVCALVLWLSSSIRGKETVYEVRPEVSLPEYRTDAARAIDAYERLMERVMDLTMRNITGLSVDSKTVIEKLDAIERRLDELSVRMARMEKALGIEEGEPAAAGVWQEPPDTGGEDCGGV